MFLTWVFFFPLQCTTIITKSSCVNTSEVLIDFAKLPSINVGLQCRRPGFDPWVGKIPWRRKWQPMPVFLPGESHGRRSLVGSSLWGHKELDTTERLHFTSLQSNTSRIGRESFHFALASTEDYHLTKIAANLTGEKAMAPHSSTLAWKIPWAEEPGRLQSMGLLGVGHD